MTARLPDPMAAALAAHERYPRGRIVSQADPVSDEEHRAEVQRQRVAAWKRRQNTKPAPDLGALMAWYRP